MYAVLTLCWSFGSRCVNITSSSSVSLFREAFSRAASVSLPPTSASSAPSRAYYPNFVLLSDLNLDYDNPGRDRARIEERIKSLNGGLDGANVNFPFLDVHPGRQDIFRTNARMTETFDQIGLFNRDPRLPTYLDNAAMGAHAQGPDYGVFEFGNLFSEAVLGRPLQELPSNERTDLIARFEHKVSDHMPLWLRLPLPVD